jgi:hypothetical protein
MSSTCAMPQDAQHIIVSAASASSALIHEENSKNNNSDYSMILLSVLLAREIVVDEAGGNVDILKVSCVCERFVTQRANCLGGRTMVARPLKMQPKFSKFRTTRPTMK